MLPWWILHVMNQAFPSSCHKFFLNSKSPNQSNSLYYLGPTTTYHESCKSTSPVHQLILSPSLWKVDLLPQNPIAPLEMREELPRNCWTPPSPRRLNLLYRRYKAAFGMPQPRIRQFSSIIILIYIYIHIYHPIFWWFPLRFSAARPYSASRRILVALYEGPPPEPAKALSEFVCQNAGVMNVGILKDPRNGSWWFIWEYQGKSMENQWNCWRFLNVLDPVLVYSYKNVQE